MKLRQLLDMMTATAKKIDVAEPKICGGVARDRYMGHLEHIEDVDITNGEKTIDYLSQEFYQELAKKYNAKRTTATDNHSTIYLGNLKMDFSSNFNIPNIEQLLLALGIKNPTDMQKEVFSRDFTCNALLLSFDLKTLIDPTHRGFQDIRDRTIRTCLDPRITLTSNKNRVIRAIYLAAKLDFNLDPNIITFVQKNPQTVSIATNKVLSEKMTSAFEHDPDKASHLLSQMGLWHLVPIPELVYPYYEKYLQNASIAKKAYYQGGGGVNEPTPHQKKYPSDPALLIQPRFEEPGYHNYDLYNTEGVNGSPQYGPGTRHHPKITGKYVAEDSWITEDNYQERQDAMKIRAELLLSLAKSKDYMLPPKEHGTGIYDWKNSLYQNLKKYKSVDQYRKKHNRKYHADDANALDFPIDEQVEPIIGDSESFETPIKLGPAVDDIPNDGILPGSVGLGDFEAYPYSAQIGGYLDRYLSQPDTDDKPESTLDFGYDLTDGAELPKTLTEEDLEQLFSKYLNPAPNHGLFGLPDGVDLPDEDLGDPTNINPDYGTYGPESLMYEDKWNI